MNSAHSAAKRRKIVSFVALSTTVFVTVVFVSLRNSKSAPSSQKASFQSAHPEYGYNGKIDELVDSELPQFKGHRYMDYCGAVPPSHTQLKKTMELFETVGFGNTHSKNPSSSATQQHVDAARKSVLKYFDTTEDEYSVIFTSGTTAGLRIVGDAFPWSAGSVFSYSKVNHNSVVGIRELAIERGASFVALEEEEMMTAGWKLFAAAQRRESSESQLLHHLVAYPAMDNFAGVLYPLEWIEEVHRLNSANASDRWFVLLDAAAFVPAHPLSLAVVKPDFVAISFYKMFGYPTGLGALIVRNSALKVLHKRYFGGGTVGLVSSVYHVSEFVESPYERFEDGTVAFLDIAALQFGFAAMERVGGIKAIDKHVCSIMDWLVPQLLSLKHSNGKPLLRVFGKQTPFGEGSICSFVVLDEKQAIVDHHQVLAAAAEAKLHLRSGCHCNPGGCHHYLNLNFSDVQKASRKARDPDHVVVPTPAGPVPLGVVRASFGYMSTIDDAIVLVDFLKERYQT